MIPLMAYVAQSTWCLCIPYHAPSAVLEWSCSIIAKTGCCFSSLWKALRATWVGTSDMFEISDRAER